MKRKFIEAGLIVLMFILQTTVFQQLAIAAVTPNLLLLLTVCFGFMRGKKEGMWIGFVSGLLIDLMYGSFIGLNALLYMYAGYLNGFLCKVFYDEDVKVPMVLVAVTDLCYGLVKYFIQLFLYVHTGFFVYLQQIILPEIVYTSVITILVYRGLYRLNRRMVEEEMEGQSSPWLRK